MFFNPPPPFGPPQPIFGPSGMPGQVGSVDGFGVVRDICGRQLGQTDSFGNIGGIGELSTRGLRLDSYNILRQGW